MSASSLRAVKQPSGTSGAASDFFKYTDAAPEGLTSRFLSYVVPYFVDVAHIVFHGFIVFAGRLVKFDAAIRQDNLDRLDQRLASVVVKRHRNAQQVRNSPLHAHKPQANRSQRCSHVRHRCNKHSDHTSHGSVRVL